MSIQKSTEVPGTSCPATTASRVILAAKIRNVIGILRHQLDPMVNLFRRTNPEFVAGHRAARVIIDRPATRAASAPQNPTPPYP